MGRKKKNHGGTKGAPEWMCTFSDMMSLLLCFFVLLFALSTIEKVKFQQAINSIQGALGKIPSMFNTAWIKPITINPQRVEPVQRTKTIQRAKEAIAKKARSRLVADEASKEIIIEGVEEGIRFSIAGRLLFDPGLAVIRPEGEEILRRVAETLNDFQELRVRIEGHSDNTPPPANSIYPNNWRLSQARAFSAFSFFRDKANVNENRMSFASCGEFRPRFPNDTIEERALNRRVEIILLQGYQSDVITGNLDATGDPKIVPKESDYVPIKR